MRKMASFALVLLAAPAVHAQSDDGSAPAAAAPNDHVSDARPGVGAATGLLRTTQATGLPVGNWGLSLWGEYQGGKNIVLDGDRVSRFQGNLGLSWTPLEFLEAFVQIGARSATNTLGNPELIQSLGDLGFGLKGMYEVTPGIHAGASVRIGLPAGANSVSLDGGALNATLLALATADLRELADVPVRAHLNLGYIVDNGRKLFDEPLDRADRFGHNVYDYNRVRVGLAVDAPLAWVTPSLEWTLEVPTGADCDSTNPQPCVSESGFSAYPSWLTIGVASAPLASGLAFNTGIDLGLATSESQGTPALPAWNWVFGITYNLDPTPPAVIEVAAPVEPVEPVVEAAPAVVTSFVRGNVVDNATQQPLDGARIAYLDTEYSAQVTSGDGTFRSIDFPVGAAVVLEISYPGYVTRQVRMTIAEEVREGTIGLESDFTGTRLSGSVVSRGGAIAEGTIALRGATDYDIAFGADGAWASEVEAGEYRIVVSAPGHLSEVQDTVLRTGVEELDFALTPLPGGAGFRITADQIVWDGATPGVTFDGDELTDQSNAALDQLATLLGGSSRMNLIVRSHTDAQDDRDELEEFDLTDARARAIVEYLVEQGVDAARLTAEGAGSSTPLMPNISDRNRRMNNRVEFIVVAD